MLCGSDTARNRRDNFGSSPKNNRSSSHSPWAKSSSGHTAAGPFHRGCADDWRVRWSRTPCAMGLRAVEADDLDHLRFDTVAPTNFPIITMFEESRTNRESSLSALLGSNSAGD